MINLAMLAFLGAVTPSSLAHKTFMYEAQGYHFWLEFGAEGEEIVSIGDDFWVNDVVCDDARTQDVCVEHRFKFTLDGNELRFVDRIHDQPTSIIFRLADDRRSLTSGSGEVYELSTETH